MNNDKMNELFESFRTMTKDELALLETASVVSNRTINIIGICLALIICFNPIILVIAICSPIIIYLSATCANISYILKEIRLQLAKKK